MIGLLILIFAFILPVIYMCTVSQSVGKKQPPKKITGSRTNLFPSAFVQVCSPQSFFIDSYEEKATTVKTSKVVVARTNDPLRIKQFDVWFPKSNDEKEEDGGVLVEQGLFEEVTEPPKIHNDILMRVNLFVHDKKLGYTSLLTQPIVVHAHLKARTHHDFSAYVKNNFVIKSGTILVLQREYFQLGATDFPNLVSVEFN